MSHKLSGMPLSPSSDDAPNTARPRSSEAPDAPSLRGAPAAETPAEARPGAPADARTDARTEGRTERTPAKGGERSAEKAAHRTRNRKTRQTRKSRQSRESRESRKQEKRSPGGRATTAAAAHPAAERRPEGEPGAAEAAQPPVSARDPKASGHAAKAAPAPDAPTQGPTAAAPDPEAAVLPSESSKAPPAPEPTDEPEPEPGPGPEPATTPGPADPAPTATAEVAPAEQERAPEQTETTAPAQEQAQTPQPQAQTQTEPQAQTQTQTPQTQTPQTQTQGGDEGELVTPTPRTEPQPQTGSPRVPAPAPRSDPEPRVEVVAEVPGPVQDFVRSARRTAVLPDDPVAAFDELYLWQARALTRQALLLCGHRRVAERAVRWAFHQAWQHWPKVLAGGDPTRTVRATVYEYALSPWHQFHPRHRRPEVCRGSSVDSAVLESFLELPRSYRAALLLHYGLGLSLTETAAEAECSTEAAAGRIAHGRAALEENWPPLARSPRRQRGAVLARTLRELAAAQPVRPVPAQLVRGGSARTTRLWTRASVGLTAAVAAATAFTLLTTQTGDSAPAQERERAPRGTFAPATLPGGPETGAGMGAGMGAGPGAGAGAGAETRTHSAPTSERDSAGSSVRTPAGGAGQAYLPQLRSTNTRGHLHDFP